MAVLKQAARPKVVSASSSLIPQNVKASNVLVDAAAVNHESIRVLRMTSPLIPLASNDLLCCRFKDSAARNCEGQNVAEGI